jgi:hypothetical protein
VGIAMYNMRVLEQLERGDISVEKAITMIKHPPKSKRLPKGYILMIRIRDEDSRLILPVPFFLISLAFQLAKLGLKITDRFSDSQDVKVINDIVKGISSRDMKELMDCIRICKSTGFVEVYNEESMVVIKVY